MSVGRATMAGMTENGGGAREPGRPSRLTELIDMEPVGQGPAAPGPSMEPGAAPPEPMPPELSPEERVVIGRREFAVRLGEFRRTDATWTLPEVALIIKGADLVPDRITERLGLEPTSSRLPGANRWFPGDTDGRWHFECDDRTTRIFSEQLDNVLSAVESRTEALASLRSEGYTVALTVWGYVDHDSQLAFSASDMARIARLNVPLSLSQSLSDR
ncbi:DUF4279 domain-containing protein [Streptomyces katsurahamanus]|uniref:DUF4279 domain-containing protein n=1 Tax=Streptomyces katsurahamanus TaxID=2577098 RepID=A0ABW9P308_9ACTN|nr:DUF4279 domain-containing protein [Streptomyces katsurahamanus]